MDQRNVSDIALDQLNRLAERNIFQRINAAQQEIDYVQKEKKQGMKYSIVSHDAVTAAVRPILVKHGVVYYPLAMNMEQNGNRTQAVMTVRFQNIDDPSDHMDVVTAGYGIDDQDKGPGKAISYSVKYALLKALGLESGDDPDTDQVSEHEPLEYKTLKMAIDMCTDLDQLEKQMVPQLQKLSPMLGKAMQQSLRTAYAQKKRDLQQQQLPTSNEENNSEPGKHGGKQ